MKRISLFLIVFINVIVFFTAGYHLSKFFSKDDYDRGYEAGWEAARKRLVETGFLQVSDSNTPIYNLGGKVINARNNIIYLKINPLEPLSNPNLDFREIILSENTIIKKYTKKEDKTYANELEEYMKKNIGENDNIDNWQDLMPSQYVLEEVKVSDIKTGLILSVSSSQDIKNTKKIPATEIIILPDQ